jgi:hypothetical protein
MIKLQPADATSASVDAIKKFNSQASWNRATGTLVLALVSGQEIKRPGPDNPPIEFKFDLLNPKYEQDGPDLKTVMISASGDVPIAGTSMTHKTGATPVLQVGTADFTAAKIKGTSTAPGTETTLSVTFTPGVLLNNVRESYIMVSGLSGSSTRNSDAIPLKIAGTPALTDFKFVAPKSDNMVSFTEGCKLADNKMMLMSPLDADLTDAWIIFDKDGQCSTTGTPHFAKISKSVDGCLEVATWSGTNDCKSVAGKIARVDVVDGGMGYYKPTTDTYTNPATVVDGVGTGFEANCVVDKFGSVTSVVITNAGSGYGSNTLIECESSCSENSCTHGAESRPGALRIVINDIKFSIVGGEWHQSSGTLKTLVREQLNAGGEQSFSFDLMNGVVAHSAVEATILAGGSAPIRSKKLTSESDIMKVTRLDTAVTAVCEAGTGECTATFRFTAANLNSYTIKAERQCNGRATNLQVKLRHNSVEATVPADSLMATDDDECVDSCSKYQPLFSYIDVKSLLPDYAGSDEGANAALNLEVIISADGLATVDHCGAGHNIKAIVTMEYDVTNTAPAP